MTPDDEEVEQRQLICPDCGGAAFDVFWRRRPTVEEINSAPPENRMPLLFMMDESTISVRCRQEGCDFSTPATQVEAMLTPRRG